MRIGSFIFIVIGLLGLFSASWGFLEPPFLIRMQHRNCWSSNPLAFGFGEVRCWHTFFLLLLAGGVCGGHAAGNSCQVTADRSAFCETNLAVTCSLLRRPTGSWGRVHQTESYWPPRAKRQMDVSSNRYMFRSRRDRRLDQRPVRLCRRGSGLPVPIAGASLRMSSRMIFLAASCGLRSF